MHNTLNNDETLLINVFLSRIQFLSCKEKNLLKKNIDNLSKLVLMSIEDISLQIQRYIKKTNWDSQENLRMSKVVIHYCKLMNITILSYDDINYPELLRQTDNPPFVLYCRGDYSLLVNKSVSVVGSRRVSFAGRKAAFSFGYDAAIDGCNVVSGLANGVDGFAHQGAIEAYFDSYEKGIDSKKLGRTIAVLPSSIDDISPINHKKLAEKILQTGGCIISEYEPKLPYAKWHYVERNRIIAALSPATVVIEAPAGSGSLITADFAVDYNRDVVFHEVAFSQQANEIANVVKNDLVKKHAKGTVSTYKIENTPQKFLDSGASVVKDYKDYCDFLVEIPGLRIKEDIQSSLFD